jgi:hypothetical protein
MLLRADIGSLVPALLSFVAHTDIQSFKFNFISTPLLSLEGILTLEATQSFSIVASLITLETHVHAESNALLGLPLMDLIFDKGQLRTDIVILALLGSYLVAPVRNLLF